MCLTFVFSALIEFALVNYASRKDANRNQGIKGAPRNLQPTRRVMDIEQVPFDPNLNNLENPFNDYGPTVTFSKVCF